MSAIDKGMAPNKIFGDRCVISASGDNNSLNSEVVLTKSQQRKRRQFKGDNENKWRKIIYKWNGLLFILPSLICVLFISVIPIVAAFYLSFTHYDVFSAPEWVGLRNYQDLINDPLFWKSLRSTVLFTVLTVPFQVLIPMILAELLVHYVGQKFSQVVRSVLFVPVIASLVLVGTVWQYMLAPDHGFFNEFLGWFGLDSINFLGRPNLALVTVASVSVWKALGYFLVLFYAGVLEIPRELYEAAEIDGAGRFRSFVSITIPGLKNVTLLCTVLATIWSFQIFDLVYAMTGGGPAGATRPIVMNIYEEAFQNFNLGYAAAIAIVLTLFILIVSAIQNALVKDRD